MGIERVIDPELCDIEFDELLLDKIPFSDGAYSKVYKAMYKDAIVCAKLIPKDMDEDDELFHLYVEREIQVSKELDHPNIVKHYGAGQDDEYFYLLTEYVPGGNMRSFIKHHRGLAWDLKVHIAIAIAQGLQHMHSKNILHRDIKSENFLVGDNWQIKICDFGFAKVINGDITKKAAHSICGTEEYMAPEMLMGLDYNDKVDIFSYGIFLAELLTQCYLPTDLVRTPATQFGLSEIAFKELLPPDCPLPLAELVIDCCNYVTSNRPTLERIIHKLHDIKEVLPRFNNANPNAQDFAQPHRRKNKRNAPVFKQEEIKITHFHVEEEDVEENEKVVVYEEVSEKVVVYEEISLEEFHDPEDLEVELQVYELQPHELQPHELQDEDELPEEEGELQEEEGEAKEEVYTPDEIEYQEDEPQIHESQAHEEEELLEDELQEGELQMTEGEPQEEELQEGELHEGEVSEIFEESVETEHIAEEPLEVDYRVITAKETNGIEPEEEGEEEEEIDYPEVQFSEFQVRVIDYDEAKQQPAAEVVKTTVVEELLKPSRPALQQPGTRPKLQKPVLQHWESRELLENTLEREFRLAREFVRSRELPPLSPNTTSSPKPDPINTIHLEPTPEVLLPCTTTAEPIEKSTTAEEDDLDLDMDMEGLQMESFIVFEYSEATEREESNFNFADTFTSKSNKYSVYYH